MDEVQLQKTMEQEHQRAIQDAKLQADAVLNRMWVRGLCGVIVAICICTANSRWLEHKAHETEVAAATALVSDHVHCAQLRH